MLKITRPFQSKKEIVVSIIYPLIILFFYFSSINLYAQNDNTKENCQIHKFFKPEEMQLVGNIIDKLWFNKENDRVTTPKRFFDPIEKVYLSFYGEGIHIFDTWSDNGIIIDCIENSFKHTKSNLKPDQLKKIDTILIILCHSFEKILFNNKTQLNSLFNNNYRGIKGLEIYLNGILKMRKAPIYTLTSNKSNKHIVQLFQKKHLEPATGKHKENIFCRTFDSEQLFIELPKKNEKKTITSLLYRGNKFVPTNQVTKKNVRKTANLSTAWLFNNIHHDGRMTYKYWPSQNEESIKNNMIRQWMATIAMEKVAIEQGSPNLWKIIERNIDYNLKHFYKNEGKFGFIEWQNKAKLGAIALAATALVQHPNRKKWTKHEYTLRHTIKALWNKDGSFNSFYKPRSRNDNQNFYPGEALLFWSILYEKDKDPEILKRFMKSFYYYRSWHLSPGIRNPAFIPWHTQAYYNIWKLTKNSELKDFIFKMNDWLLLIQEKGNGCKTQDTLGRFYTPNKPYGKPHSSSTGVYLEGLIDSFNLAIELKDVKRANQYRKSIIAGLRSVMQLQFANSEDMFYTPIAKQNYVRGGIRTTVYNNEIRCDNVQHNLMALLKILNSFQNNDYYTPLSD